MLHVPQVLLKLLKKMLQCSMQTFSFELGNVWQRSQRFVPACRSLNCCSSIHSNLNLVQLPACRCPADEVLDISFHHTAPEPTLQPLLDQLPWFFFYAGAMSFIFACLAWGIFKWASTSAHVLAP